MDRDALHAVVPGVADWATELNWNYTFKWEIVEVLSHTASGNINLFQVIFSRKFDAMYKIY